MLSHKHTYINIVYYIAYLPSCLVYSGFLRSEFVFSFQKGKIHKTLFSNTFLYEDVGSFGLVFRVQGLLGELDISECRSSKPGKKNNF